jgi:hypothetical protein
VIVERFKFRRGVRQVSHRLDTLPELPEQRLVIESSSKLCRQVLNVARFKKQTVAAGLDTFEEAAVSGADDRG